MIKLTNNQQKDLSEQKSSFRIFIQRSGILLILLTILIIFMLLTPELITFENLNNMISRLTVLGVLAAGMTFVIATGGIDLSVGSILAFSGVVVSILMKWFQLPVTVSIIFTLFIAFALGAMNGFFSSQMRYRTFIVTLGSMYIIRGATLLLTDGVAIWPLPSEFIRLSSLEIAHIPVNTIMLLLIYVTIYLVLTRSYFGRQVFAVGENKIMARMNGVNVNLVTIITLGISGVLAGLAGIIMAARLISGQPNVGQNYELEAIAACVVGGASLSGGRLNVWRTFAGVLVITIIRNAFSVSGLSSYIQMIILGSIIISSLFMDKFRK